MVLPHQRQKLNKRKKDKGKLFILSGWRKEGKEELGDQRVFPSVSFFLCLGIFSSLPLPE